MHFSRLRNFLCRSLQPSVLPRLFESASFYVFYSEYYQQVDDWIDYRQYRAQSGSKISFKGAIDLTPFLSVWNGDWWMVRFEVKTDYYQNSAGAMTFKKLCFEINGTEECAGSN